MWTKEPKYSTEREPTDDEEEQNSLLSGSRLTVIRGRLVQASTPAIIIALVVIFALGALLGRLSHVLVSIKPTSSACARLTTQYSPLLNEVNIQYNSHRFNGSLLKPTVYRLDASPEVDAAWEELGVDYRALVVPYEEGIKSGMRADQVKVSQKYGGGFLANVEGLHQLHCLNVLRKALYYNFEYYHEMGKGAFANSDTVLKYHITHCLDIIRQQLMCTVDTGLLGQVWFNEDEPEPYVDFNTRHTCKNFEAIRRYAEERQAPADVQEDYLEPPNDGDLIYNTIP